MHFCKILFNRKQDLHLSKISVKNVNAASPRKLCPKNLSQFHILKLQYSMNNFKRFHAVEPEMELSQKI